MQIKLKESDNITLLCACLPHTEKSVKVCCLCWCVCSTVKCNLSGPHYFIFIYLTNLIVIDVCYHRAFTSKLASSSWRLSASSRFRRAFSGGCLSPSAAGCAPLFSSFTATEIKKFQKKVLIIAVRNLSVEVPLYSDIKNIIFSLITKMKQFSEWFNWSWLLCYGISLMVYLWWPQC